MSLYVDASASAVEHCEAMSSLHPDLSERYRTISSHLTRKLYHQLTVTVMDFVLTPDRTLRSTAEGGNSYLALYDRVVLSVDKKLNQLSLARIASYVADSLLRGGVGGGGGGGSAGLAPAATPAATLPAGHTTGGAAGATATGIGGGDDDGVAAKAVLENLLTHRDRLGPPATLFAESKLALLGLNLIQRGNVSEVDAARHLEHTKEMLKRNARILDEMTEGGGGAAGATAASVATSGRGSGSVRGGRTASSTLGSESDAAVVHAAHYECAMVYRKAVGPPEAYYREAIRFLHYTPLDSLAPEKKVELATDLSMSALTGDGVYNFGEVVQNPILRSLDGTPRAWLVKLMDAGAMGDVVAFERVSRENAADIASQPALTARADVVREKIALLALVHMVFERPASERTLTFLDIAERIQVPVDSVELAVMRALSLGLIKGSMDQTEGTVDVTWVMPRVLDRTQLQDLARRFGEWAVEVSKTKDFVAEQIPTFA